MGGTQEPADSGKTRYGRKKYLDDYELVEIHDESGRTKKKIRYTGKWTMLREPDADTRRKLWLAFGLAILLFASQGGLLLLTHRLAAELWVMLPLLTGLLPALYLLMGACTLPFRLRPMRRDQYAYGPVRVTRSAKGVLFCAFAGLFMSFAIRIVRGIWDFGAADILLIVLCLASGALARCIILLMRGITFEERENAAWDPGLL